MVVRAWGTKRRARRQARAGVRTRPSSTRTIAVKALKKANQIGKPEFKAIYTHLESVNTYTAGAGYFALLNGCSQGDGLSSREGRQIRLRSLQIHFKNRYTTASPLYGFSLRAIVFIDLEPHGATPTATQLLRTDDGQGIDEAPRNLDFRNRFIILKDKFIPARVYENNGTTFHINDNKLVKYKKLNLLTTFDASNSADITDITKGALYLYLFCAEATNPQLAYISAVVRFTDN